MPPPPKPIRPSDAACTAPGALPYADYLERQNRRDADISSGLSSDPAPAGLAGALEERLAGFGRGERCAKPQPEAAQLWPRLGETTPVRSRDPGMRMVAAYKREVFLPIGEVIDIYV